MKNKGFTITEVIIVMVIFSIFVLGMIYLLNTYMSKVDRNIKLLDAINRMTQAGELVTQYLIKATGNATSIEISDSGTEITFNITLAGNIISAKLTVINNKLIKYSEDDQVVDIPIDDVNIKFGFTRSPTDTEPSTSGRLPIIVTISTANPFNPFDVDSSLRVEYKLYPPGIR